MASKCCSLFEQFFYETNVIEISVVVRSQFENSFKNSRNNKTRILEDVYQLSSKNKFTKKFY